MCAAWSMMAKRHAMQISMMFPFYAHAARGDIRTTLATVMLVSVPHCARCFVMLSVDLWQLKQISMMFFLVFC